MGNPGDKLLKTRSLKTVVSDSGLKSLRQDLSSSDKDPDIRRTAMDALKDHLELLDLKTTPDFSEQASESKEVEASRHYAISLYSELAKVHKHELIPFIPRIMASVLRSLPSSGGSQQLQQVCAKVVTSVARYTIDPAMAPSSNEEIIRSLCSPLLPALSSRSEPLAVGTAVCLQALVESEKWKCAPLDLQHLLSSKGTSALTEKATQTVPHVHLMRSLAKFNSCVVQQYGEKLLRAGMDILQAALGTSGSWHLRVATIQLLGAVLKIADAETLELDLSPIVGVLEGCRLDKVAGVRSVAGDALETAKVVAAEIDLRHDISSEDADTDSARVLSSKSHIKRASSNMEQPISQEYMFLSDPLSPNSETPSDGTVFNRTPSSESADKCTRRSPLFPVKQCRRNPTSCASLGSQGLSKAFKFKENTPAETPIAVFPGLPNSSRIRNNSRDLSDLRRLKDLTPKHHNGNNLKSFGEVEDPSVCIGSKSLRVSFPNVKLEREDSSAQCLDVKRAVYENDCSKDQIHKSTNRSAIEKDDGIGCGTVSDNVDLACFPDLTEQSRRKTENGRWNMVACSKDIIDKEQPIKDGNASGELEADGKEGIRDSDQLVGLVANVCCNECADLLTPESAVTLNSENGDDIQMAPSCINAEVGHICAAPRSLICTLPSAEVMAKFTRRSGVSLKDCPYANNEKLSETSRSTLENLSSGESDDDLVNENQKICFQNSLGTATSSCYPLGERDFHAGGHLRACMQSEEQISWKNDKDCKCLAALFDSVGVTQQCHQDLNEGLKDLSLIDENERNNAMQVIHDDFRENGEGNDLVKKLHDGQMESLSWRMKLSEQMIWGLLLKTLKKTGNSISTYSVVVVNCLVLLIVASIIIRHLSNTQNLHILVPT